MEQLGQELQNEGECFAVGPDVTNLFLQYLCETMEITETLSTRLINNNTHQYAATFKTAEVLL